MPGRPILAALEVWSGEQGSGTASLAGALLGLVIAWGGKYSFRLESSEATPTGMGPDEALLSAGLAVPRGGGLVLDPFCGGGSLLAAAAHLGAAVQMGTDMTAAYLKVRAAAATEGPQPHSQ